MQNRVYLQEKLPEKIEASYVLEMQKIMGINKEEKLNPRMLGSEVIIRKSVKCLVEWGSDIPVYFIVAPLKSINLFGTQFNFFKTQGMLCLSATGIVTGILFYRRWRNDEIRARSKGVETNHETWICTKAALSLIGMATIAR